MTNMQAALGVAQLKQIDAFIEKKKAMGQRYTELLAGLSHVFEMPPVSTEYAESIYWVYGLILKEEVSLNAKEAMKLLGEAEIGTRPFFFPMHMQPVFNKQGWYQNESYPVAERMAERGFYIPSGLGLSEDDMHYVTDKLYALFL